MDKLYTAGELAKLIGVTSRTVRYYDKKGILKPVGYSKGGYRLYNNNSAEASENQNVAVCRVILRGYLYDCRESK